MPGKRFIEFVEYEELFFGKPVAKTEITGMTEAEVAIEVAEMHAIVGEHCAIILVEEV
jgi:hypothetical protein